MCVAPAAPTPLWAVPWPPGHEKRTPTAADAHDLKIVVKLRAVPASKVPFPVEIAWFPDFSRPVPVYPAFLKYVVPVHSKGLSLLKPRQIFLTALCGTDLLSYLTLSAFRKQQTLRGVIFSIKKALQISLESFVFLMDLRTGMRFCVYIFQLLIRQLRINLRGGNIGMTQHFLHRAQVRTVFD